MSYDDSGRNLPEDESAMCEVCQTFFGVRWYTGIDPYAWVCEECSKLSPREVLLTLRASYDM